MRSSNHIPRVYDQTTNSILRNMNNVDTNKSQKANRILVTQLTPGKSISRLELVVLRTYPRRLVSSANYTGQLAAACGRDETGIVGIVLWDNQVNNVKTGDIIRIENGWCRTKNGEIVVSTGKNGKLTIIDS